MKVVFYASDKPREHMLAKAMSLGCQNHRDSFEVRRTAEYGEDCRWEGPDPETDVAVFFGVKGKSKLLLDEHLAMGKCTVLLDKGYSRHKGEGGHTEYSRAIINGATPAPYMMEVKRKTDRFERLKIQLKERRPKGGSHVLFCASSAKYHAFHGLDAPELYASRMLSQLRRLTDRHFVYRPKPSDKRPAPLTGVSVSLGSAGIEDALRQCHVLVTHGSSAALDAVFAGVPAIVLGSGIASPVAGSSLEQVEKPFWPALDQRLAWASAMAYCQWTTAELRSGEAWGEIKAEMTRQAAR